VVVERESARARERAGESDEGCFEARHALLTFLSYSSLPSKLFSPFILRLSQSTMQSALAARSSTRALVAPQRRAVRPRAVAARAVVAPKVRFEEFFLFSFDVDSSSISLVDAPLFLSRSPEAFIPCCIVPFQHANCVFATCSVVSREKSDQKRARRRSTRSRLSLSPVSAIFFVHFLFSPLSFFLFQKTEKNRTSRSPRRSPS